tara:strand:- start:6 stop:194 length:189 start_codon:yes stop_codon:yes gene_type:complete
LGKKILKKFEDCFSSKTLKTDVATTNGKKIIKLNIPATINIDKFDSLYLKKNYFNINYYYKL